MPPRNMPAPVHLTMKELFEGELPTRPVALQLTAAQVIRLSDKAEMVKKVPPGTKGMLVVRTRSATFRDSWYVQASRRRTARAFRG